MMGISLVKNPKILVEETVRSTAVGTSRISHESQWTYGFSIRGRCEYRTDSTEIE